MAVRDGVAIGDDRTHAPAVREALHRAEKALNAVAPVFQQRRLSRLRQSGKPAARKQRRVVRPGDDKKVIQPARKAICRQGGDKLAQPVLSAQRIVDRKAFQKPTGRTAAAAQLSIGRKKAERTLDVLLIAQAVRRKVAAQQTCKVAGLDLSERKLFHLSPSCSFSASII